MIVLKTPGEIERMREAGRLVAEAQRLAGEMIRPGVTTGEIDAAIEHLFTRRRAVAAFKQAAGGPFPAASSISVNEQIAHAVPGARRLQEGDIVSVDTACRLNGWCADAAWTYAVGRVDSEKSALLRTGRAALESIVREMGLARRWSQVARAVTELVRSAGLRFCRPMTGHGIGREMHEDPQVDCLFRPEADEHTFALQPGLALAVEPAITAGNPRAALSEDGWTLVTADGRPAAHFEHTVAMTEAGPRVLTAPAGAEVGR